MKQQKVIAALNVLLIAVICILNYFYQKNGFDFALKCTCSGLFVLLGLVNCIYAFPHAKGIADSVFRCCSVCSLRFSATF